MAVLSGPAMAASSLPTRPPLLPPPLRSSPLMQEGRGRVPDTFALPPSYTPARLRLPPLGVGTLAWGDPNQGWGVTYNTTDIREAFELLVDGGVSFFDTSEVYGYQGFKVECS